ncbi:hypothetical protein BsWGS_20461 [Bradybaena similaris]
MSFTNNTNNTTETLADCNIVIDAGLIVSYQVLGIVQIVNYVILGGAICLVGMVVNIINMIIFVQQGLDNTVNIGMFAISLSDWCSLVTLEWTSINANPFMEKADVPFEPEDIRYLTGIWPHACFIHITMWLTVYVTAERFVCIAFPLKVKQIVTPFRTKIVVTSIYLLVFISVSPMYVLYYFGDNFYPSRNETRVGIKMREEVNLKGVLNMLTPVLRTVACISLIILTCMLVIALRSRSDWRKRSKMDTRTSMNIRTSDAKIMKMVSLVAGLLIISTAPSTTLAVFLFTVPESDLNAKYDDIVYISSTFISLLEAINSTVNTVLFYKMSTKFRRQFQDLFPKCLFFSQRGGISGRGQSSPSRCGSRVGDGHNMADCDAKNSPETSSQLAQTE